MTFAVLGGACSLGCTATEKQGPAVTTSSATPSAIPEKCDPGTMPSLTSGACELVGPTCAAGFEVSVSGWGCSPILPSAACTGATRAVLGQPSCVAVDDCDAAFPPKNATAVVHDDASLESALASVGDGATIALDSGTYSGIEVPLDFRTLHLVGRCADKVKIKGTTSRGVYVASTLKVSLESMTIEGFEAGIVAAWGADVTASKIVVRDAQLALTAGGDAAKLFVKDSVLERTKPPPAGSIDAALEAQKTGSVTVEGSDIRGYDTFASAFESGTKLVARRSVFTYSGSVANTNKIVALASCDILFDESALRFRNGRFAFVARDLPGISATTTSRGGNLHFKNSTVTHAGAELDGALSTIHDGGQVSLEGTTLEHQSFSAWMVGDASSAITTKDSVIRGLVKTETIRNAIWVLRGGAADLDHTAIVNAQQNGLVVSHAGSRMTLTKSLVYETFAGRSVTDPEFGAAGIGVLAAADATLSVSESAFVSSNYAGVFAAEGAQVQILRSVIDASRIGPEGTGGCGLASAEARVIMEDSLVRASQDVALVFLGGEGIVKRTHFIDNPVGVHISETRVIQATEDPLSSAKNELIFFQNVFEGTTTPVREAPYEPPTAPTPLGH